MISCSKVATPSRMMGCCLSRLQALTPGAVALPCASGFSCRRTVGLGRVPMSWLTDLTSNFGIPSGVYLLAGSIYGACLAAERAARPEALADIGRVITDRSWLRTVSPAATIVSIFNATFGEKQVSIRCALRSCIASALLVTSLSLVYTHGRSLLVLPDFGKEIRQHVPTLPPDVVVIGVVLVSGYFLSDYLAVAKTRWLLSRLHLYTGGLDMIGLYISDIILSVAIGSVVWVVPMIVLSNGAGN